MESNHHVYIEAINWDGREENPEGQDLGIRGTEPAGNGFTRFYSYSIGGGIRREKPWETYVGQVTGPQRAGPFSHVILHGKLPRVLVHSSNRFCDL